MAKQQQQQQRKEEKKQQQHETSVQPWGTLEELLLACAVNRHGTKSWDSIATEVQNRISTLPFLTSQNCKDKFNDLKRRFMSQNDTSSIIDQLRKIRVEELRREVQQRDVSIVSLKLKVKRLEEERDRSLRQEADLITEKQFSPGKITGKFAAGNDSGDERDNRSFNESNSTGQQKAETTMVRQQNDDVDRELNLKVKPDLENNTKENEQDPIRCVTDPGAEQDWSHNDNSNKIAIVKNDTEIKLSQTTGGLGESNESVGECKREEKEKEKQNNSDVQSSACLPQNKKKRRRTGRGSSRGGGGDRVASSSGEEPEGGDEVSAARKRMSAVKSEPLVKLIGIIRSHRLGSTFERRLRSQESERYKSLIRRYIDLQTIQSRLDKGVYSSCMQKFFRDLLLLFSNAIIFFEKNSVEHLAACELRAVVRKEMTEKLTKPPKSEPKQQPVSFSKPSKSSSTIVACRKSNSAKAIPENATKRGDKKDREVEEKPKVNEKKIKSSFNTIEEKGVRKKRTKDHRSVSSHKKNNTGNNNGEIKHQYGGNELSSHDALEMKVERKGSSTKKRQGAASFLKRMKQNSPSEETENDDCDEDGSSEAESKDSKGKEDKGRRGSNKEGITERVTRSSRVRGAKEESGRGRRTVGRPPKKQADMVESGGGTGKRGRENGGSEARSGGGRARKRPRR